jgi:hypothetical protein
MRAIAVALTLLLFPQFAFAWDEDGHKIIALIAEHYLTPDVRHTVDALLAQDTDPLTQHDIASAATWADEYSIQHRETAQWHFVAIDLDNPDVKAACYGRPQLPSGTLASKGPADACVLDKIMQFAVELTVPNLDPDERLVALKFLLHLVGDVHQPLHAADNHDHGGHDVKIIEAKFFCPLPCNPDTLHELWDRQFIGARNGCPRSESPRQVAQRMLGSFTPEQKAQWGARSPRASSAPLRIRLRRSYGDAGPPTLNTFRACQQTHKG